MFRKLWKYICKWRHGYKDDYEYMYVKDGWLYYKKKGHKLGCKFHIDKGVRLDMNSLREFLSTEEGRKKSGRV